MHDLGDPAARRKILEQVAKVNGFDPLNPENWYSLRQKEITKVKV